MKKSMKFVTHTPSQTKELGFVLGKEVLQGRLQKRATVIGLQGELGSGKTTFVQGVAKGFGIKEKILSPTFVIIKSYKIRNTRYKIQNLYHIDCYRVKDEQDLVSLGWDKIVSDPKNLVLIEWPERVQKILPKNTIFIFFKTIKTSKSHSRQITFSFGLEIV